MERMYEFILAIWNRMKRKKHVDIFDTNTDLKRCLTLRRLTFIGVGKTVGVGIYVLIGVATKEYAGPSVVLSFLIGFLVTLLNGLCFAEYASRNPKTGAQYTYMYETLGEAVAFIVGWTSVLGYTAAFSLASRGWSGYLDSMFNHAIQNFTVSHIAHWSHGPPYPEYPDFPAIFIIIVVMVITSVGVNFSTIVNSILAGVSAALLVFITVFGLFYADFSNWFNSNGGFFPYGFKGVLKASSACFYAFQGFEILGLSAEETVNPGKTIPLAIVITLVIVTVLYLGVAVSFTLMIPFTAVNTNAPFPGAFQYHSVTWAKYLVAVGPILALSNLCSLELFTIQRLTYSMATDGLLFKFLSKVNKRTKVPIGPILAFGPVVIILVLSIDLSSLIGFMVTYTFIQYSLFAAYMIVLRYKPVTKTVTSSVMPSPVQEIEIEVKSRKSSFEADSDLNCDIQKHSQDIDVNAEDSEQLDVDEEDGLLKDLNGDRHSKDCKTRNKTNGAIGKHIKAHNRLSNMLGVDKLVVTVYFACLLLAVQIIRGSGDILSGNVVALFCTGVLAGIILVATVIIWSKEQKGENKGFLVPLMPFLPVTALFFNMLMLVSTAESGSLLASFTMAAVGVVVYLLMVTWDILKGRGTNTKKGETSQENVSLLDQESEGEETETSL